MPVRIKKRKVKKGGNIPLLATHDFNPIFFIFFISKPSDFGQHMHKPMKTI